MFLISFGINYGYIMQGTGVPMLAILGHLRQQVYSFNQVFAG
jgi:hypothetical protein